MRRRKFIALVSAWTLLALGALVVGTGVMVTRTSTGREQLRAMVERQLRSAIRGQLHLGRVSGNLLTEVVIDTIAIRDQQGELFLSAGPTRVRLDPRDLLDKRVRLAHVETSHPWVHVRQYENGEWNFRRIFRGSGRKGVKTGAGWGDYVVVEKGRVTDGTYILSLPWHPDDTLRGAKRDSSIRVHLQRPGGIYRQVAPGQWVHRYTWSRATGVFGRLRLAHPDSAGQLFTVDTLRVEESDPPFSFRNIAATARRLGDSVWFEVPHFDVPGSTGRASGKVVWGSGLPIRYAVRVRGDSVSLNDVNWVYPTLPRTGGGRMVLDIRNDPRNLRVIDYKLTQMDVRSTGSHLTGAMTFSVGGPVLAVKDVALRAQPVDFELIRTLNGKPFPVDWQGTLTGTVQARGGPLNHFYVDQGDVVFRDRHVRGAVSHLRGRGELDILLPAFTAFHGFRVEAERADLRTVQYLFPNFPRLGGTISGAATLDSSWLDVRFRDARVAHSNGPGAPSVVTGSGRVTWGELFMTYDVAVAAEPVSMEQMRRAYPALPLRGVMSGPIRAKGTVENLDLDATLAGEAGTVTFKGNVDVFPPGYRARGGGLVEALDASRLLVMPGVPPTRIAGRYDVDVLADSLPTGWRLGGRAQVALDRSVFDGLGVAPSAAALRFADGRVHVDSLVLETSALALRADGALGLRPGISDSLRFQIVVDSLGGLRQYLTGRGAGPVVQAGQPADSAAVRRTLGAADSLGGSLVVAGVASGNVDSLDLHGRARGQRLLRGTATARSLTGSFALRDVLRGAAGSTMMRLDTVVVAGVRVDSVRADVALASPTRARFGVHAQSSTGPSLALAGLWTRTADSAQARILVDTLSLALDSAAWRLAAPAELHTDEAGLAVDTLVVRRDGSAAHVALWGSTHDSLALNVVAEALPLADLAALAQLSKHVAGSASARIAFTGAAAAPVMRAEARLTGIEYGGLHIAQLDARGDFHDRRLAARMDYFHQPGAAKPAVSASASVPMRLSAAGVQLLDDDSLRATVRADEADLSLVEAVSPGLRDAKGTFTARLDVAGTPADPLVSGALRVADGAVAVQGAGITLHRIFADVDVVPGADSLVVRRMVAQSGPRPGDTVAVRGFITFARPRNPYFDLRLDARSFQALDRRALARLSVSTGPGGLQLTGPMKGAVLTGSVRVDRGSIYIPDVSTRDVQPLSGDDFLAIIDTTDLQNRALLPQAPSAIVEHLQLDGVRVTLGDDMWLRSAEANVKLGGSLSVTRVRDALDRARAGVGGARGRGDSVTYRLALEGALSADRGTYTLTLPGLQREFQVQEGGTITFLGTSDLNPAIDISALYRVKQVDRPDVGVRAHLTGYLYPQPTLRLESAENYALSQSDLVSYLVTGRPSLGQVSLAQEETAVDLLLPTANAMARGILRSQFGSWVDALSFEAGSGASSADKNLNPLEGAWARVKNGRVSGEMQLRNNLYFSVGAGACFLQQVTSGDSDAFQTLGKTLSGKLVYRFPQNLAVQAGREPASSLVSDCSNVSGSSSRVRGVIDTPSQWGLSLSRSWRF